MKQDSPAGAKIQPSLAHAKRRESIDPLGSQARSRRMWRQAVQLAHQSFGRRDATKVEPNP